MKFEKANKVKSKFIGLLFLILVQLTLRGNKDLRIASAEKLADEINISASIGGNVADSDGDGLGDNHNVIPGPTPVLIAAGVDVTGGEGSNGVMRMQFEWDIANLAAIASDIASAQVTLQTYKGTVDSLSTEFFWGTIDQDGSLTSSDFEMPVTSLDISMPVIDEQESFTFDVTSQLIESLDNGFNFFSIQGRVDESLASSGFKRGLQVRSTAFVNPSNLGALTHPELEITFVEPESAQFAYVYQDDLRTANSFSGLLLSEGFSVDLINLDDVFNIDFSNYQLVLIASDTGWGRSPWGTEVGQANHIHQSGVNVIGLGYGGSVYFEEFESNIGWLSGWVTIPPEHNGAITSAIGYPNLPTYKSPYDLVPYLSQPFEIYSDPSGFIAIWHPESIPDVIPIGLQTSDEDEDHYTIIAEGCDQLWGYIEGPELMTENGKKLFINTIEYSLAQCPPPDVNNSPITVSQTVQPEQASLGDTVTFETKIRANNGNANISLKDIIPFGFELDPLSITGGARLQGGEIVFDGVVSQNEPLIINYSGIVNQVGSIINSEATVTSEGELFKDTAAVGVQDPTFDGKLFLIYTSGDNSFEEGIPGVTGLSEHLLRLVSNAEKSADNEDVKILLVLDGPDEDDSYLYELVQNFDMSCPNYLNPTCANGEDQLYQEGVNMWRWSENVGSPYTLAEYLKSSFNAYPEASGVVLSLVGHGGGWSPELLGGQPLDWGGKPSGRPGNAIDEERQVLGGMLWDQNPGDSLSTADLSDGLRWALEAVSHREKIDVVYLDACLMGMAEVAYQIRDQADVLIASESWSWTSFGYDNHVRGISKDQSAIEMGLAIFDSEVSTMENVREYPYSVGLIDLNKSRVLYTAIDAFSQALIEELAINPSSKAKIDNAFRNTECFDSDQDGVIEHGIDAEGIPRGWDDNYCDLQSFVKAIKQSFSQHEEIVHAADSLLIAIGQSIIREKHGDGIPHFYSNQRWSWGELGGISIYLPLLQDDWKRQFYNSFQLESVRDGKWDEFLNSYWGTQQPNEPIPTCPPEGCFLPAASLEVTSINLTVEPTKSDFKLSWMVDDENLDVHAYHVWRSVAEQELEELTSYHLHENEYKDEDNSLQSNQEYCYQVEAVSSVDESIARSNIVCSQLGEISLWIPDQAVSPEVSNFFVPVNIGNGDGLCPAAFDITITYDHSIVRANGEILSTLYGGEFTAVSDTSPGRVRVSAISQPCKPLAGAGTLFMLGFDTLSVDEVVSALNFNAAVEWTAIYDEDDLLQSVPLSLRNGSLFVNSEYILGDVDGNGFVNSVDAYIALQIANGEIEPSINQFNACNVNQDDSCDSGDVVLILCFAAHQSWEHCMTIDEEMRTNRFNQNTNAPVTIQLDQQYFGETSTLEMILGVDSEEPISGLQFSLTYDPLYQSNPSIELDQNIHNFLVSSFEPEPGVLRIALAGHTTILSAELLKIKFEAISPTAVHLDQHKIYDPFGRDFERSELRKEVEIVQSIANRHRIFLPILNIVP